MNKLTISTERLHLDNGSWHGMPVAKLVRISSPTLAQAGQNQRVASAMQHLRQLGAESSLGCTLQQAAGQGRD